MEQNAGGPQPYPLRLLGKVTELAREASALSLLSLTVRDKAAVLDEIARAQRALESAHLGVVRALDGDDLSPVGATSVAALVSARMGAPRGRARADVAAARATEPDSGNLPGMGRALAAGEVSRGHLDVAVATLEKVPCRLRRECATTIDAFMVTTSRQY